jgi:hypothetical protein
MSEQPFGLEEAARRLGHKRRWLQTWLRDNPADAIGEPFYTPIGRVKEFIERDIVRIRVHIKELERCRLNSSRQGQARPLSGTSAERTVDALLMRQRKRETKRLLSDLRSSLNAGSPPKAPRNSRQQHSG